MSVSRLGLGLRLGLVCAFLVLAFSVYNGAREGANLLRTAGNGLQVIVAVGQLAYAVFGLLALVGWWRRRPGTVTVLVAWSLSVVTVAAVASVAWVESPRMLVPAVSGLAAGLLGGCVTWCVRRHLRTAP
jgi:hypothetical protein